jgi:transcription-repair coupling factor (superfamily II helicase)
MSLTLHHLLSLVRDSTYLHSLREAVARGDVVRASAIEAARPALVAALHAALGRPTLVVTARPARARQLAEELRVWVADPARVALFPENSAFPYERLLPDPETAAARRAALAALVATDADGNTAPPLVVTCVRALLDRLMPPAALRAHTLALRAGARIKLDRLLATLGALGYTRVPLVEGPGEFAQRGGIVDIFPAEAAPDGAAVRLDFFGDEIETLRRLDPATQRSGEPVERLVLAPAYEVLPPPGPEAAAALRALDLGGLREDLATAFAREHEQLLAGQVFPSVEEYRAYLGTATLLDYLPAGGLLVLDEPAALADTAAALSAQAAEVQADLVARGEAPSGLWPPFPSWEALASRLGAPRLELTFDPADPGPFEHPLSYAGRLGDFLRACAAEACQRAVVVVTQQDARLRELLVALPPAPRAPAAPPRPAAGLAIEHGALHEGWRSEVLGLTLYTDREVFGWSKTHRVVPTRRPAARETFLSDFAPGEYVVHLDHGIARYRGLVTLGADRGARPVEPARGTPPSPPAEREYLLLEYAAGDVLYVPVEQSNRVSRYVGASSEPPHLTRLSSGEWTRAKQRARRAVREIAHELLELYAAREIQPGHAFAPDTPWQAELEGSFPYLETPDQLAAIGDVKRDMERPRPMDRLLVGDVGYGKTEIALRAAFKAVMDGKQVAMLVPTTVLAQQHFNTFSERLAPFPVRVEMLSRFRSEREQQAILEGLARGTVDICIGTHRLLQKDVAFKDLGLVIIDEEQRFGVTHKERLKHLRREVDVLTLSATPIPRTLHMALAGVRDLSTMATPPEDRLPVRTFVSQYDEGLVRDAILRELERGGQVYFVHNRVRTIAAMAAQVARLVPEARVAIGHGQMPEDALERVMLAFAQGEYDVLVCSTIIESGLDIPNVNTLIVHQAHRFGLAQLYQLRGRVGRGATRAYAYFLYTRDGALTPAAEERLRTIAEATELGAGFRIAMKDLEIRGAGNLLGAEQHGHISAVGFDLYCRLLAEAVESLRALRAAGAGKAAVVDGRERLAAGGPGAMALGPALAKVSLPLPAHLPSDYVPDEAQRLNLYQRLAGIARYEDLGAFMDELEDRFGPLPDAAHNLLYLARLRLAATEAGIQEIDADARQIVLRYGGPPPPGVHELARRLQLPVTVGHNQVRLPRGPGTAWREPLRELVDALADARARPTGVPAAAPIS